MNKIEIKKENLIVCGRSDALFKSVVGCEKGKHILKAILEEILKIKIDNLEIINCELEKLSLGEKGKRVDCLVRTKDSLINVEVNTSDSQVIRDRNLRYLLTKHINQFRESENYNKINKSIQINLDWEANYEETKKKYMLFEENNSKDLLSEYIVIYKINMDKLEELCYTCDRDNFEFKYSSMLTIRDKEKLLKYCKGDRIMEEYAKETIELNNNDIYKDIFTKEKDEEIIRKSEIMYATDKGIKAGIERGIEQRNTEIAKNMLEKNMDVSLISELTGLTIEEIKNIK